MSEQEQIEQLKAQVNCLRDALIVALENAVIPEESALALEKTPEQCLAEVKANAIEEAANSLSNDEDYHHSDDWYINYLLSKAKQLREQAK